MSGLIVPVDVTAYCIGRADANKPARSPVSFAGATTDYSRQTGGSAPDAFLGINVTRDADQSPLWPLETGVHLHWAMPDALTRADTTSGRMTFPPLPNRWLVTRIAGHAESARHWIVESDTLSNRVPVWEAKPGADGARRGSAGFPVPRRAKGLQRRLAEPARRQETLAGLTGAELHAVTTGDIAFAAFYPNSRTSFGFHDDLADLAAAPAELMYVVTGWYATPANDPLNAGLNLPQLQTQLRWTFNPPSDPPVTYSLYSGLVQGIQWNPRTRYLTDLPEPISGDVAIGSHPAEALAAYFRGATHPALPAVEELLTLYLTGLLPSLATPAAGELAALEEALHELQFTAIDGGTVYTIMRGASEATELPPLLADALNLLNICQQAADIAAVELRQAKWQLFSSWYRLFEADPDNQDEQNAARDGFSRQLTLQSAVAAHAQRSARAAADQKSAAEQMLTGSDLTLTPVPAARYYAPAEPVVLLAGDAAAPAERYGGDGRYHPDGYLACRRAADLLQSLRIVATTLCASKFAALAPSPADQLPYAEIATLIQEAALLNTAVGAAESAVAESTLAPDLRRWLQNPAAQGYLSQPSYGEPSGVPPSPVAVNAWPGANPWMSLMLLWEAQFHPLLATAAHGTMVDYPPGFFTANYRLDPGNPRMIAYVPAASGITIDPGSIDFDPDTQSGTCRYTGASVLSPTAADNLRAQVAEAVRQHAAAPDTTLQAISDQLKGTDIAMQGLTGFNDALLTRQPSLQLSIGVSPNAPRQVRKMTGEMTAAVTSLSEIPPLSPQFDGDYNAVRAGYMKLSLRVMDPFGRKRPVAVRNLYIAESLVARVGDEPVPDVIYAQPRLAQGSRLLFRWLAADTTEYDEMNAHPATTPVCGWLLPDHLSTGFFLYNAQGDPLGSLTLSAGDSAPVAPEPGLPPACRIAWQAAPGDQATVDADLGTVMAHQNPHLRDLALALGGSTMPVPPDGSMTPARFRAFWRATDTAITQIVPTAPASQAGLATLVGRPLALVQTSLRLERQGLAALDRRSRRCSGTRFADTDHAVSGVQFPVVLGDLHRLDDGLVGYFKQAADGRYDTGTFFSQGALSQATPGSDPGVAVPSPASLQLGPASAPQTAPDTPPAETKLLMLVDPRAAVHATTGILPTQSLAIPAEQYEDILAGLELAFPVGPLLRGSGGLAVPVPAIVGYDWSWITEEPDGPGRTWAVDPALQPVTAGALWQYSPQTLTEGWLRLNPRLLQFRLTGAGGAPVVTAGATTSLELLVKNTRAIPITFTPATTAGEMSPVPGSIFYIHFGSLVDQPQVQSIQFAAAGWRFEPLSDARYGSYWAATPDPVPVTLAPGEQVTMTITDLLVAPGTRSQSRAYFDYYNLAGIDDGIDVAVLTVQQPAPAALRNTGSLTERDDTVTVAGRRQEGI